MRQLLILYSSWKPNKYLTWELTKYLIDQAVTEMCVLCLCVQLYLQHHKLHGFIFFKLWIHYIAV